jgi:hypothetical protein
MLDAVPRIPPRPAGAARGRRYKRGHPGSRQGCSRPEELRANTMGRRFTCSIPLLAVPPLHRPAVGLRFCCYGGASSSAPICTDELASTTPIGASYRKARVIRGWRSSPAVRGAGGRAPSEPRKLPIAHQPNRHPPTPPGNPPGSVTATLQTGVISILLLQSKKRIRCIM